MENTNKKTFPWLVVVIVAAVVSAATVVFFVLRAKARKERAKEQELENNTCMSFDCEGDTVQLSENTQMNDEQRQE